MHIYIYIYALMYTRMMYRIIDHMTMKLIIYMYVTYLHLLYILFFFVICLLFLCYKINNNNSSSSNLGRSSSSWKVVDWNGEGKTFRLLSYLPVCINSDLNSKHHYYTTSKLEIVQCSTY